ncbi:DUF4262 domain-containing protein [Nocardia sp. NPDC052316]|uniref:DUF4262 domain-containing protein n=1 Tax=Nocardia sp. NPDC052316 TaxID=3364329 RepID=UPI0037CB1801
MLEDSFECRCILCHDHGDRDQADGVDLRIIDHVRQYGWHVVMVVDDDVRFAYTIGLSHSHGAPELAMFGLDVYEMNRMLNTLGAKAAAGTELKDGLRDDDVIEGRPVALRAVDPAWHRTFFGRARGFYRGQTPLTVLQVAWPDADHHFHWEDQARERDRGRQPQLWLTPEEHPAGMWTADAGN